VLRQAMRAFVDLREDFRSTAGGRPEALPFVFFLYSMHGNEHFGWLSLWQRAIRNRALELAGWAIGEHLPA